MQKEAFLEDISNILNTGEIPNLFAMEEKMQIQDACTKAAQAAGATSSGEVFARFVDKCRACLHVVLCLSPRLTLDQVVRFARLAFSSLCSRQHPFLWFLLLCAHGWQAPAVGCLESADQ